MLDVPRMSPFSFSWAHMAQMGGSPQMTNSIRTLLPQIQRDPWRAEVGFSDDIRKAQEILFNKDSSDEQLTNTLNEWIEGYQPCLFGRVGAKNGYLSYCILK